MYDITVEDVILINNSDANVTSSATALAYNALKVYENFSV